MSVKGVVVMVIAALCWPLGAAAEPGEPPPPVTEAPDRAAALAAARHGGQPVEVTALRTETARVFANTSGSMTLEQYALPVRTRRTGRWEPIDTTLVRHPDGSVRPRATLVDLRVSGGGSEELVALATAGRRLALAWPAPLPAPELAADTATYPEVLPGVDLLVRAKPDGFFQALVVHNAAAAANPALRRIRYRLATTGLTMRASPDGASTAVDENGRVVFTAPAPSMWDSSAKHRVMGLDLRPDELAVLPDPAVLSAPDTRYPVYLDPSYSAAQYRWAPVFKDMPNTSFWTEATITNSRDTARVGYQNWTSDITQGVWRSLFQVNTAPVAGAQVLRTWFSIRLDHSADCAPSPVNLYRTAPIDPAAPLTWNSSNASFGTANYLDQKSAEANDMCGPINTLMEFSSAALTTLVQTTANNRGDALAFGLRTPNEGNRNEFKKFSPTTARLNVEYNSPPRVPTGLSTVPPTGCGAPAAPAALNTATPTFSAIASDPDNDHVATDLEILSGDTVITTSRSVTVGSGSAFTWPPVPAGRLPTSDPNAVFSYRARTTDGALTGGYGERCYFTVDLVRPAVPTISSADYPNGTAVRSVGEAGTVTFTKAAGDTDVAGFRYGFSSDRISQWVAAQPDGTAAVPVTLWPSVPDTTIGIDRNLFVQAIDKAGNAGPASPAWALTAKGRTVTSPPVRGDVNGDRRADVTTLVDHGDGRTAGWTFVGRNGGFHSGYIGWDSGINGGFPAYRIRSAPGDYDGDGRTDLAVLREDPDKQTRLFLLRSDGNRLEAFGEPVWTGAGYRLTLLRLAAADIDADGDDDLVALQALAGNQTRVLVHHAAQGRLGAPVSQWDSGAGGFAGDRAHLVAGDFDGDADDDAAVFQPLAGGQTRLHVLISDRTRLAAPVLRWDSGAAGFTGERASFAAGNIDGDPAGRDEVVATYDLGNGTTRLVAFLPGPANWTTATWWEGTYDATRATLTTGDFTADGRADVAMLYDTGGGNRRLDTFVSTGTTYAAARADWTGFVANPAPGLYLEPGRRYRLIARHSNKCAEIQSGITTNAAPLRQWDCVTGATNQQFTLERIGATPLLNLKVVATGRCLDVENWSHADNARIVQWTCGGNSAVPQSNQEFQPRYVEGSGLDVVVQLPAAHSGKCLNVAGVSQTNGAAVVQWPCGNPPHPNDQFYLRPEP